MSEEEKPIEFSAFDLMPDWAQGKSESKEKPARRGRDREEPGESRGRRGGDRDRQRGGGRRGDGGRGHSQGRGSGREGGGDRGDRRQSRGGGRRDAGRRDAGRRDAGRRDAGRRDAGRTEEKPAKGITARLEPTASAVAGLTRHINETLRAFPVADLAKALLRSRDRYQIRFRSDDKGPAMYITSGDSVWLTRDEAVADALREGNIENYYEVEEVETEPPKGNFAAVAVCGMSGQVLGPPNHHEYQRNVARLHASKFANMPLEKFKSRIVVESGEEAVEKWREQKSRKRLYRERRRGDADQSDNEEKSAAAEKEPDDIGVSPDPASMEDAASEDPRAETESTPERKVEETVPADHEVPSPEGENTVASGEEREFPETETETETETAAEEGAAGFDSESEQSSAEESEDAEQAGEDSPESESESGSESDAAEESAAAAPPDDRPVFESREEVERHFRKHSADDVIREVREIVVPGDIKGTRLSRGLLAHVKQETESLKRGFPLPLVQSLCRAFEKQGMRFFKRGKKILHVSRVRPRAIDESVSFTEQIRSIVDEITKRGEIRVVELLEALADDFTKPEENAPPESLELTPGARSVLTDLRWLTSEGYVIEFPDTRVALGKRGAPGKKAPPKKKTGAGSAPPESTPAPGPVSEDAPTEETSPESVTSETTTAAVGSRGGTQVPEGEVSEPVSGEPVSGEPVSGEPASESTESDPPESESPASRENVSEPGEEKPAPEAPAEPSADESRSESDSTPGEEKPSTK